MVLHLRLVPASTYPGFSCFLACCFRVQCRSLLAHVTSLESIYRTSCGSIWSQRTLCPTFFDVWNCVRIHVVLLRVSRTRRQAWLQFYQLGSCPKVNQLYAFQLEPRHDKGKHLYKDGGRSGYCACKENVGFASLCSAIKVTNKRPLFLPTASFFCNSSSSQLFQHKGRVAWKESEHLWLHFTAHHTITINVLYNNIKSKIGMFLWEAL